ncbi:hypothetical protein TSUD_183450 [Trifolium subterraneum]|uniref:Reverse transcriptase zinc-binding domain-containing protein n=1 Tax=Trifolium subterraneum TaxID=3900 RepID=A0A2Z6PIU8_TRISU|nr:hypothetical protein TSUD_183450 [Trifolium subterraneum]
MLVGVIIADSWLAEAACVLGCRVGMIPFMYLGLPIGGEPRRLSFWEPVVNRIRSRLNVWKSRFLSFGGRLVLLKSVLTSLSVYALSFFKAPSVGKTVCMRKEAGGLGVRKLREFNEALLGKWCWRALVDKTGLWYRVLAARYGEHVGRVREGGRHGSTWWREIVRLRDAEGAEGEMGWFAAGVERRVGNGVDTFFWIDLWLGGIPLSVRFRRLFDLSQHKLKTVAEMRDFGWGSGGAAWLWRRQLWVWEEEMVVECRGLLSNIVLQNTGADKWVWWHDPGGGYTVRGAYNLLTRTDMVVEDDPTDLIWHKQVPTKVSILAWRLLRNRLPTKDNLVRRHVITPDAHFCVTGCGEVETAQHLFLSCSVFAPLWSSLRAWIGIYSADPLLLRDHCVQFSHSSGDLRARRSFLQLLWLCSVWVVWQERNNRLFKAKESTVHQLLEKIKVHSLWWMKAYNKHICHNSHMWWSSPLVCLSIA